MKRTILSALALCAVGAAALATGSSAMAQQGGYYDSGYRHRSNDANYGYRDERRWRRSENQQRYYGGRTPMGGRNPGGCYYDDGGGRIYSCDAGGRR